MACVEDVVKMMMEIGAVVGAAAANHEYGEKDYAFATSSSSLVLGA